MLAEQRKKLMDDAELYVSIGITEKGERYTAISVPWDKTVNVMNMKTPSIWLAAEDLYDKEIMAKLKTKKVNGCFIFVPLEDYSFLCEFNEIWTLFIYKGRNIKDLSFMKGNSEWFQLYIEDASFKDFEDIFPGGKKQGCHSYCLGLVNCNVEDKSLLLRDDFRLSELYVAFPKGTNRPFNPNRRKKWIPCKRDGYFYGEYIIKNKLTQF